MATGVIPSQPVASNFWSRTAYHLVIACIVAFLALTALGMLIYPGGTNFNKTSAGYQFFSNYFSDLGRTAAHNGAPNNVASPLFTVAMTCAGAGLALFFLAFVRLFTRPTWVRVVSLVGTGFGLIAGVCFIGVGWTPSNVLGPQHGLFVLGGFVSFFVATLFYIAAILGSRRYPHRAALAFIAFAVLLGAYVWLQFNGPRGRSLDATLIQATGQKIIAYASLLSVLVQSLVARKAAGNHGR